MLDDDDGDDDGDDDEGDEAAGAASDVPPEPEEHPVTAKANRQLSPIARLGKLLIAHAPALVTYVSDPKQKRRPEGKPLTPCICS
ncbi:hypothetical protein [Streptomyces sp. NPDC047000]|uniref:hypothetical protein n=1 Tax=Streptomyces sp. NPDC047000 TaxID=3155474 RepID=UPI0033C2130B